jgi:23S rRNA (uracil1939-C5)-methyltransferase/tRNA (uracil-5-)-methyltransferase
VTLRIDDLSNLGEGVGRVDLGPQHNNSFNGGLPSKYVIMVPGTMPGDVVRARVWQNRRTHSVADLVEVVEPAPGRIPAPCPHFGTCGGCQYQFMGIEAQRAWKQGHVASVLERIGGFPAGQVPVQPVVGTNEVYGDR